MLAQAIPAGTGCKWLLEPGEPRVYPNFSHGTSGVAYFLARLAAATAQPRFLDAALRGARYLESIAQIQNQQFLLFRHEPDATTARCDFVEYL